MTRRRIRATAVAVLLTLSVLAVGLGTAAPVGETGVSVSPENTSVQVNSTETVEIVVTNASLDVKGYALSVDLTNGSVADIVAISPTNSPVSNVTIGSNNDSVHIDAAYFSRNQSFETATPTILSVAIRADAVGSTNVTLTVEEIVADMDGNSYNLTRTYPARLTVRNSLYEIPGMIGPSSDLDSDSFLEDVNGDGTGDLFDALAYYNNRGSSIIQDHPDRFDFDGDGSAGDLFDALALYNELQSL